MIAAALLVLALVALYFWGMTKFRYWNVRGVKNDRPLFLFGNNLEGFILRKSVSDIAVETYWKYPNEKVVGFYRGFTPELVIRDPDIAKKILIADFKYFYPRGLIRNGEFTEPLTRNLFFADGDLWKLLRQRMTPAFTSGKLKAMFPLVVERAERLQARAREAAAGGRSVDCRDLMSRFAIDFTGACGFGIEADSLNNEHCAFLQLGTKMLTPTIKEILAAILKDAFPAIFKNLKIMERIEKDLFNLVNEILEQRDRKPSARGDFVDLLLECQQKGTIVGESIERTKPDGSPDMATLEMDEELIAAQVFVFFLAGYETSSSATSFTLHQLAYNQRVQRKVQEEIDSVLAKYDNKLCYDAIKEMTYLEWTFKEGLRMLSPVGFLMRRCARDYHLSDLNLKVDRGTAMIIPVHALHHDPKYFESPEIFCPERFSSDTVNSSNKHVYLPFGDGPRACIGARLGLMQSLAGLAAVLSQLSVRPGPRTVRFPAVDPKAGILQRVKGGLPLIFERRTHETPAP